MTEMIVRPWAGWGEVAAPESSVSPEPDTHRDRQKLDVIVPDEHAVISGLSKHPKGAHHDVDAGAAVEADVGVRVVVAPMPSGRSVMNW